MKNKIDEILEQLKTDYRTGNFQNFPSKRRIMKKECSCEKCIECCWRNPGWFGSIEEIEGAAKIMKMKLRDFIKEYLIQEWWAGEKEISIPAPRRNFNKGKPDAYKSDVWDEEIQSNGKGFLKATWGHNLLENWACIFLDDNNKCLIHKSKPKECRVTFGCNSRQLKGGRKLLIPYWRKHQDFINNATGCGKDIAAY